MVWYSRLFKNFPQFVVIHTVKGFGTVNNAEVVFLELSCFFDDPVDVGNLISGSSAFSKSILSIWKFTVHILLKLAWRMGKTRDLFKKIRILREHFRDSKGRFHAKMGTMKDRNGMDLTETENIKKRWQEYTEELQKRPS